MGQVRIKGKAPYIRFSHRPGVGWCKVVTPYGEKKLKAKVEKALKEGDTKQ